MATRENIELANVIIRNILKKGHSVQIPKHQDTLYLGDLVQILPNTGTMNWTREMNKEMGTLERG